MPQVPESRRSYDHRIREIVCQTGNPRIFQHLRIPRSTTASWLSRGRRSVVSLDWQHDIASVLDPELPRFPVVFGGGARRH